MIRVNVLVCCCYRRGRRVGAMFGVCLSHCGPRIFGVRIWCDWRKILVLQLVVPKYVGGDKILLLNIDEDKWSFFEFVGIQKDDMNCTVVVDRVHDDGLKELALNIDAIELTNFALSTNTEVLVYVDKINDGGAIVSKGDVVGLDDGNEGVGNEVVGVKVAASESNEGGFQSGCENDNEEERTFGVNDGFDSEDGDLVNLILKEKKTEKLLVVGHPNVEEGNGEFGEGYEIKEIYSVGFESDEEDRHKFVRYRKDELSRDFEFEIGMDFCSLHEFKEVIVDHSIMNRREVAKAKCKDKYGYEIFCSKIGRSHTYKIKTFRPKHHYGRVFSNKNANSKWVSKIATKNLKSSDDIMDVMRLKYGIGITLVVAWKVKTIAKAIVDEDVVKQYYYLEAYSEELKPGLVQTLQAMGGGGTYEEAWEDKMAHVKEVSEEAYDWLMTTVPKKCMA
ncbi:hypothetical protein HKD37_03G007611 [Glycine soja]